jgi:hypothetical protein
MKKLLLSIAIIFMITSVNAQKFYTSTGGEIILSNAFLEINGQDISTNYRFTLFYHMEENYNWDFSKPVGIYTGLGIRNVGLIANEDYITKYRSYTLGIPLAIKIGNLEENTFLYGGMEYEWLFHYKEKDFENDTKSKYSEWFSERTNQFVPSAFVGYQLKSGMNFRFKMYLDNFFNEDYSETTNGVETFPYQNITSQIYYFSISFYIKNKHLKEKIENRKEFFVYNN